MFLFNLENLVSEVVYISAKVHVKAITVICYNLGIALINFNHSIAILSFWLCKEFEWYVKIKCIFSSLGNLARNTA